ncbi:Chitin synthase, class 5 [Puccinia graminis f. sp. tritici]|uniref:Chitin synthase, class 5 n=1 Tax=Puccinia graminis f. sp. tritici TaxID=56615 RepID=A0A5B0QAS4_PUCGR|nr:Chitin synthase, class 5 [Puccinia graminis f. sp. tritici]
MSEGIPSDKLVDNGKDNPFSAASPTISNLLPLGNWPSSSQSNSLNHGNFGGLLSPASNQFGPLTSLTYRSGLTCISFKDNKLVYKPVRWVAGRNAATDTVSAHICHVSLCI